MAYGYNKKPSSKGKRPTFSGRRLVARKCCMISAMLSSYLCSRRREDTIFCVSRWRFHLHHNDLCLKISVFPSSNFVTHNRQETIRTDRPTNLGSGAQRGVSEPTTKLASLDSHSRPHLIEERGCPRAASSCLVLAARTGVNSGGKRRLLFSPKSSWNVDIKMDHKNLPFLFGVAKREVP